MNIVNLECDIAINRKVWRLSLWCRFEILKNIYICTLYRIEYEKNKREKIGHYVSRKPKWKRYKLADHEEISSTVQAKCINRKHVEVAPICYWYSSMQQRISEINILPHMKGKLY